MLVIRLSLLSLALTCAILTSSANGKVCSEPEINSAATTLPAFTVIGPDESPQETINKSLGCEYPFSVIGLIYFKPVAQELIGKEVLDAKNQSLGTINDLLIGENYQLKYAIVDTGDHLGLKRHKVAIPAAQIQLKLDAAHVPFTSAKDFASLPSFNADEPTLMAQKFGKKTISYKMVSSSGGIVDLWRRGLYPLRHISLLISSIPAGANIIFKDVRRGTTSVRAVVKEQYIKTLRLEMDGFTPCKFDNGKYEPANEPGIDFVFRCKLSRQSAK